MKVYMVGGCVRDKLLGLEPKDVDYVVVGGTPEEMLKRGFERVGASFPVFLHPVTREEHALARTERKTGVGYNGFDTVFDPTITLEDDLRRRDLTINAMALDPKTGEVIDPFGGQRDLKKGILRHTSEAFAEDPVRVLRTARFAARYGFAIAPETTKLMEDVAPELDFVPKERIWAEIEKGLMERYPVRMLEALNDCGALGVAAMEMYCRPDWLTLDAIRDQDDITVRFSLISTRPMPDEKYEEHRIPVDVALVNKALYRNQSEISNYVFLDMSARIRLLMRLRAFNKNQPLLDKCLAILEKLDFDGSHGVSKMICQDVQKARGINIDKILSETSNGKEIGEKVFQARVEALTK